MWKSVQYDDVIREAELRDAIHYVGVEHAVFHDGPSKAEYIEQNSERPLQPVHAIYSYRV